MINHRAVRCREWGGPDQLVIEPVELAQPEPREVQIQVAAAGVNFPDVLIIQKKYQLQPPLPFTPGAEIAGTVLACGSDVRHVKVGDRVAAFCGIGGFATVVNARAEVVAPIPAALPFPVAASLTLAYGTSWHALADRAQLKAGETLLILGASGGVGLAAIEIAKALGARVIACASHEDKLEICRAHGADATIQYEQEDLRERVKALTEGRGADVVYDAVGGRHSDPAFRSIAWRGRYLVVGFAAGDIPALPLNLALLKGASIVGVFWGEFAKREPAKHQAGMQQLAEWLAAGKIRPRISRTYTLDEVPQALKDMADRKVVGKVVILPA
jgi:NADPH:quinone reductase